jgi:hypothetical protein
MSGGLSFAESQALSHAELFFPVDFPRNCLRSAARHLVTAWQPLGAAEMQHMAKTATAWPELR